MTRQRKRKVGAYDAASRYNSCPYVAGWYPVSAERETITSALLERHPSGRYGVVIRNLNRHATIRLIDTPRHPLMRKACTTVLSVDIIAVLSGQRNTTRCLSQEHHDQRHGLHLAAGFTMKPAKQTQATSNNTCASPRYRELSRHAKPSRQTATQTTLGRTTSPSWTHGKFPGSPPPVVGKMEHATSASATSGGTSINSDNDRIAWKMREPQEGKGHRKGNPLNISHELRHLQQKWYGGNQEAERMERSTSPANRAHRARTIEAP